MKEFEVAEELSRLLAGLTAAVAQARALGLHVRVHYDNDTTGTKLTLQVIDKERL